MIQRRGDLRRAGPRAARPTATLALAAATALASAAGCAAWTTTAQAEADPAARPARTTGGSQPFGFDARAREIESSLGIE